ncbi:Magnesium protoporphyrin IX methyltransferase [Hibiscus syriacus]|uniref:Magnesium protoporphyrin IX methyltransferase n=1 Tax=Hibiscus syriacus TaxID=106335 RepID=A0A6A2YE46_HIBSY|nr:Magnesium protoporphyrin IX methyltransferase [Hibiscus syriacus]
MKATETTAAIPPLSIAASVTDLSAFDSTTVAFVGGGSIAALAAVLSVTDPERRCRLQAKEVGGGDKEVVRNYFNNFGFQRWKKIYGETDDVNKVQLDIRLGHSKTIENSSSAIENVMKMLTGSLKGVTVCDAGCGTGCLAIPLAKEGTVVVSASDISAAMVAEAEQQAEADVERALNKVGWKIRKRGLITTQFYFARLVEAVPA